MSKKKEKIMIRVGIDFGKTIGLVEEEDHIKIPILLLIF